MAATLSAQTISTILDELPHACILRAAAVSRRWRAAATAHARFFRYISLVHGEHSPVTLSADPRVLRFFAQLKNAAADERTPLAVRIEIWAAEAWAPSDYACIGDMVLPALRTAMPRIVQLDVRLPPRYAGETFAAAPRLRGLVLGVVGRPPARTVPVPVEVFHREAPSLRAVRLQGMHVRAAARPAAFSKVPDTRHDPPAPEDRALSTLQLIDIERGRRPDAAPRLPAAEGIVPLAPAIASRMYRVEQLNVRYSAGNDVAPFLLPGGGLHALRIAGSPAGMSVHLRAYARPECKVSLTPGKPDDAAEMLEAIAAALPRATVRALEVGGAFAPQFFAAFGGRTFAHAHTVKIVHTRQPDAAAVLAALLRLLPARTVACGARCPVLRALEIEWARDEQKRRLVLSRDHVLMLAAALGISVSTPRVRLRIRGIDIRGGGKDCRRVFDVMFDCTIEA